MLDAGGVRLVLATNPALEDHAPPLGGAPGAVLVSLNTDTSEAVDRAWEAGQAAGGNSMRAPHQPAWGGRAAWLSDPDGHPVEIVWNPRLPE